MNLETYKKVIGEDFSKDVEFIDSFIKTLNLGNKSKILDVGTGWGAMAILLALNGFHVLTGQPEVDPEWDDHKHHEGEDHHPNFPDFDWRKNARSVGVEDRIEFQNFDALNLDFPDGSFDGVFMYDALQHMKDKEKALNECIRVSASEGKLIVIEWNKKTVDYENEQFGYDIEYVDPRNILNRDDIEIKANEGEFMNIYMIKKINEKRRLLK
jgi:ubiquinone/menaquinone biosynthesis C-methylase UbiE